MEFLNVKHLLHFVVSLEIGFKLVSLNSNSQGFVYQDFGEKTLSLTECKDVSRVVSQAHNNLNAGVTKYNASRNMSKTQNRQREALRSLAGHLSSRSDWSSPIKAFITGRRSEVVIKGVGAVGISESSMKGLNKGDEIDVVVTKIEPDKGILIVRSI